MKWCKTKEFRRPSYRANLHSSLETIDISCNGRFLSRARQPDGNVFSLDGKSSHSQTLIKLEFADMWLSLSSAKTVYKYINLRWFFQGSVKFLF